jgi:hypothetical protein
MLEWFWRVIVGPVIVGAILSPIPFLVASYTAPDKAFLKTELRWVDIESPIYGQAPGFGRALTLMFPIPIAKANAFVAALDKLRSEKELRVAVLTLTNNSNVRTHDVEVTVDGSGLMYSGLMEGDQVPVSSHISVRPIDPGAKSIVYVVVPTWSDYVGTIRTLEGGKRINIEVQEAPEQFAGIVKFASAHPRWSMLLVGLVLILSVLFVLSVPFGILYRFSVSVRAWMTSSAEVKRINEVLAHIKVHYPERITSGEPAGTSPLQNP